MNKKQIVFIGLGLGLLTACGGGVDPALLDGGASNTTLSVKLGTFTSPSPIASIRTSESTSGGLKSTGVSVSAATMAVDKIKLKLPEGLACADVGFVTQASAVCKEETEIEDGAQIVESQIQISGPLSFDLITGVSTPDLGTFVAPSGTYRKIKIEGQNLVADGTFLDKDNVSHKLHVDIPFEELQVKLAEDDKNVQVIEGKISDIALMLNPDNWFVGFDLAQCVKDGSLVVDSATDTLTVNSDTSVSSGDCKDIAQKIRDNVKQSLKLESEHHDEANDAVDDNGNDGANHA